jgi:aryl sulfotransferase
MAPLPPNVTRVYQNHTIDSTRWHGFQPREGDVVVTTSYKSGTTWTLGILYELMALKRGVPRPGLDHWVDARFLAPLEEQMAALEAMEHPRVMKSHLAADGLPIWENVKYVVVGRDARDVFMSLLNHYASFTDEAYRRFNETPGRVGDPMPRYDGDVKALFRNWITRGWFPWESEGWPWWGNLHHVATWWPLRDAPNVMLLHYNDLQRDVHGEIGRLARFVGLELSEDEVRTVAERSSLAAMREGALAAGDPLAEIFEGGARSFFYKGTNERWRGVLGEEDLQLYEAAKGRVLPPECAEWLEQGTGPRGG